MGEAVSDMSPEDLAELGILEDFEGTPVTLTTVSITNAAGAFNSSLEVDPTIMHQGEQVYLILRCDVTGVEYGPIKGDEGNNKRVHKMRCTDATVFETKGAITALDAQRKKVQAHRERLKIEAREAKGESALFPPDDLPDPNDQVPQNDLPTPEDN